MNLTQNRLHGQSGGGTHAFASDWLAPLNAMLMAGKRPANGWIVLSLVGDLASFVPYVDARLFQSGDDLSSLRDLSVEIVVNDETRFGFLFNLVNAVFAVGPRVLGVSIGGASPTVVVLKEPEGSRHGT